jgi:hypothetical protein
METLRQAWASLLGGVPVPLQDCIALVITLAILTKIAPRVVRGSGQLLRAGSTPLLELLTYPEFLVTTTCRDRGWQLPPGTYAYGQVLGGLSAGGTRLGGWLQERFARRPRFPWKTAILITAVLVGCWYLAPKIPASGPRNVMTGVNSDAARVSDWLATGQWPTGASQGATCPPSA